MCGRGEVCGRGGSVWKGWRNVVGGVRCVMGGVEVCGRGEVCVCVCGRGEVCVCMCVEGVEVCGRSKVYGWWEHVYASIVYRCLHMCIVCVVCCVCVCVLCVCVCVCCVG